MIILPLPTDRRLYREFHVSAAARRRYDVDATLVDLRGRVATADPAVCERLAARMNDVRDARRFPENAVGGAEILAAGLVDESIHLVLDAYRREHDPDWLARLDARLTEQVGPDRASAARRVFAAAFPPAAVARGVAVDDWLRDGSHDLPNAHMVLEERIAVRLANENPALARLHELVDDSGLGEDDAALMAAMQRRLAELPVPSDAGTVGESDLWSLLRAPMRASPTSLEGQLAYIRRHWGELVGPAFAAFLERLVRSLDLLAESRAGDPPGPPGPAPVLDRRALMGSDAAAVEAFSPDAGWMPQVVLIAKNAYVWLDQLSRRTGREIRHLDGVPDEALAELRAQGMNGLWLIGLWQRSEASARIKRRRGQEDAVASAYALHDYRIADDLGGEEAWRSLRDRASGHGLRLASDMVPNHVGIDGHWVAEHPDWFVQLPEPPYPGYSFSGPDLADEPGMEVRIEDGYWDASDAAVVFERRDARSGERRYLYHGNDGTQLPWNDTAQLDYLNPQVREAVIGVILDVARRFPIIRFDAAMTLAKEHVQRLWYPPPGHGGAIPSRSVHGSLPADEFERRMPVEFWREVVDRVAAEAPDTLLLAEAFWMMEGYFVRTLGMHRVYNSAFMNMLAREANADYQEQMRNVLTFEPQILARFVNFMNNPDEETAIEQFGDGDKAFGVATLMATLPGLPMFGHGQVEGLREKYGMEYRRAKLDESPQPHLVSRHLREIAPLLARRADFAGTAAFRLFEVQGDTGPLGDVFAYANRGADGTASLVLYHNRYAEAHGRIHRTVPFLDPASGEVRTVGVREALALGGGEGRFVRYREHVSGLERLIPVDAWLNDGLEVRLGAYGRQVLLDLRELHDADGRWARLHAHLAGRAVPSLDDAFRDLELAPLHRAFEALLVAETPRGASERAAPPQDDASSAPGGTPGATTSGPLDAFVTALAATMPGAAFSPSIAERLLDRADSWPTGLPSPFRPDADRAGSGTATGGGAGTGKEARSEGGIGTADDPPGRAWRRAWAVVAAFAEPAAAARDLRLDRVLARAAVPSEPVGADGWVVLWFAMLPDATEEAATETPTETRASAAGASRPSSETPVADERSAAAPTGADASAARGGSTTPARDARDDTTAAAGSEGTGDAANRAGAADALATLRVDGPVRRVLGVHEHGGVRWFRHEGFTAWSAARSALAWMTGRDAAGVADLATRLADAGRRSGFDFDRLTAGGAGPSAGRAAGRSARPGSRSDGPGRGEEEGEGRASRGDADAEGDPDGG